MKLNAVTEPAKDEAALEQDYKGAREIGVLRIGEEALFFRARFKTYYIPYRDISRYYRRVLMVPARLCCGRGGVDVESLIVEGEAGELAQIQLPGTRAAKELMLVLKDRMPDVPSVCPKKEASPLQAGGPAHA